MKQQNRMTPDFTSAERTEKVLTIPHYLEGSHAGFCISVVIPVYNARPYLSACLDAVKRAVAAAPCAAEIIVVDNGSTDGSEEWIRDRYGKEVELLSLPGRTVSAVRNFGAARAAGDFLSFVDADCVLDREYYVRAVSVVMSGDIEVTGGSYALPDEAKWIEQTWHDLHALKTDRLVSYINAGNLFISAEAFQKVGGFDESLESGEDAELGERLRRAGYKIYDIGALKATHLGNPKSISQFFRQQFWHGLGMLGTARHDWRDKPLLMTILHVLLFGTSIVTVISRPSVLTGVVGILMAGFVPCATVVYRMVKNRVWLNPFKSIVLYEVYFLARACALVELTFKRFLTTRSW